MPSEIPWRDFYTSDLQSLWALLVVPFAFLIYSSVRGHPRGDAEARFVRVYCLVWAVQTMLDPLATGPLAAALGIADGTGGTVLMFVFVLLGDLRVFVLIFGLALRPGSWIAATCGYALVVPLFAGAVYGGLGLVIDDLHGQVLWLAYELGFVAMATYLARVWIPRHVEDSSKDGAELAGILRSCAAFSAAYYSLWAAADLMVLAGLDEGWAVRVVPNQLYYAFWVPFVYARYFSSSRAASSSQQATSSSTQAAR